MRKISYPLMGDYGIVAYYFLGNLFGYENIIIPPAITEKTVELGVKYSPEFVCTPFKYTLGTMIECASNGADILIQLGGGCRYGYYGEVQDKILSDLGFDVTVINLITQGKINVFRILKILKKNKLSFNKIKAIYYLFVAIRMIKYMDSIDEYIRENIGFEVKKGSFENLKSVMLKDFKNSKGYFNLRKKYRYYLNEFLKIKVYKPDNCLKVGIIGELYTLMEPFSNYYIEKNLALYGIEVRRFTNAYSLLVKQKKESKNYMKYISEYVKYPLGADGHINVARAKYLCENNYNGIIHIKSAFCTPEIGAMCIINKVVSKYDVPLIFFTFDTESSSEGVKTRLEAFYDMIEMRNK